MHLRTRYLAILIGALAFLIPSGIILIQAALNSWSLPECWRCGGNDIRRSATREGFDSALWLFFLAPYRCRRCQTRFYAFRTAASQKEA